MRTIFYDLSEKDISKIKFKDDDYLISSSLCKNTCIGCFSCWIKHPGICCYKDSFSNLSKVLKQTDELVIISKSRYGCYSSDIKRLLERCLGYVLPYFAIRDNMIHHELRYDKNLLFHSIFYGSINRKDKELLNDLVKANSINLNANYRVDFCNNVKEIKKCIS